ncbi:MAG: SMI1/KNR4 family protein [Coriobacteriales bacterium]|jgi:hypothetical protein|nr:SMI1/KNR4 family protein [Coriobacteriales bacterium]
MNSGFQRKIARLASQGQFQKIIVLIEQIPESGRDREIVGSYVRALNNTGQCERAIEVSLRYKDRDEAYPLWHYRLGYAFWYLDRLKEAKAALLRGKELAKDDTQITGWIDELLERIAELETFQRAAIAPRNPSKLFFDCIDSSDFWDVCDLSLQKYTGAPATDEMFAQTEKALGYRLPESYKQMMRRHNGGLLRCRSFPFPSASRYQPYKIHISGVMGVDPSKPYSLCGEFGCRSMIGKWKYPAIGIAVCNCPSEIHNLVFLDYRYCGPAGEPGVVHIDQEDDYTVTCLAPNFEGFILGLEKDDND